MPELPEVETTRRGILAVVGGTISAVDVRRAGVIEGAREPAALLMGCRVTQVLRWGKELLIGGKTGKHAEERAIGVHLGMTGSLRLYQAQPTEDRRKHTHVVWTLADGRRLEFHDPRRFGGVWTFTSMQEAQALRWTKLGPDALIITPTQLHAGLQRTRRALKAALLDQTVIAGLGNIYVDELLFRAGVHPGLRASRLRLERVEMMVPLMRDLLRRAIRGRGSTVRDYLDGEGKQGSFQFQHQVYGRGGEA